MKKKQYRFVFNTGFVLIFFVLLYHLNGIFYPSADTPAWRHAIFVLINIIIMYGLLKRPYWFTWFIAILTLQQWYSHGSYAYMLWQKKHIVHWPSIGVIVLLPLLFVLLFTEKKLRPV